MNIFALYSRYYFREYVVISGENRFQVKTPTSSFISQISFPYLPATASYQLYSPPTLQLTPRVDVRRKNDNFSKLNNTSSFRKISERDSYLVVDEYPKSRTRCHNSSVRSRFIYFEEKLISELETGKAREQ